MAPPRLIVVDGPDRGVEFAIGPEGGGIGRGEGNAVQLSDLAVSRTHCTLRADGDALIVVDAGSRNRTLVNDRPVTEHRLAEGDVIAVGKTRLRFQPGGAAPHHPSIEISLHDLMRPAVHTLLVDRAERARRHLAALARVGDVLRQRRTDRETLARAVCDLTREALDAERVVLLLPSDGRLVRAGGSPDRCPDIAVTRELETVCLKQGNAALIQPPGPTDTARMVLAAPVSVGDGAGLLLAERPALPPRFWTDPEVQFVGCAAHIAAGALDSLAARELLALENRALEERLGGGRELVGTGPVMRELRAFIGKVGPADATVLLTGESGSGKEMVAQAIHGASRRASGPFIGLSCATLTENLLESELFGHEKGAFTGATERKIGRFELAHGGTLFFDEVGELTPKNQTKLLRVLEERSFERVGGTRPISVDVRVIAATNRDLQSMVARGEFREDLFYRLSVIQHEVPPLRARADDIPALAEHFLQRVRYQTGRKVVGFAAEAVRAMLAHPWPGNCRELRNAVERAVVLGEGELIRLQDLPPQVASAAPAIAPPTAPSAAHVPPPPPRAGGGAAPTLPPTGASSLRALERQGILAALTATGGNKAQAAAILEIDRSTLYKKLKEYGIEG